MPDFRDRLSPDTERGARLRACRSYGSLRRPESRTGVLACRLPAEGELAPGETRAERLERLRREVAAGTYHPDLCLVAQALLAAGALD